MRCFQSQKAIDQELQSLEWRACRYLFQHLQQLFSAEEAARTFQALRLDSRQSLSQELLTFIDWSHEGDQLSLLQIAERLRETTAALPVCSEVMRVNYIWQVQPL